MKLFLVSLTLTMSLVAGLAIGRTQTYATEQAFELSLIKLSSTPSYQYAGQVIHYTFTVINSGDYDIPGPFSVSDSKIPMVHCPDVDKLSPGQSLVCTGDYTIRSGDMLEETVTNAARAEGGTLLSDLAWNTIYNDNQLKPIYLPYIQHA